MPDGIIIRGLGPGDAALLLSSDVFDDPPDPAWTKGFLDRCAAPGAGHVIVVALHEDRVIGFASGAVLHHPDKPPQLFVMVLGVNEDHRRRGIAAALIAELRGVGRQKGCTQTWIATEGDNTAALAFYAALGGRRTDHVAVFDWPEAQPEPVPDGA